MKKLKTALLTCFCLLSLALSTNSAQGQAYRAGELAISGGIGFGTYSLGAFGAGFGSLPLVFQAEYGINDIISGGAFLGFRFWNNSSGLSTNFALGARASGHLFPILNKYANTSIDDSKADVYLAVLSGYEIRPDFASHRFIFGSAIGAKYYFLDEFLAVFAELGAGALTYGTIGITLRVGG